MSYFLYMALVILSIVDFWTTFIILTRGGVEKNPMVNFFVKRWGIKLGVIVVKIVPLIVMGVLVWMYPKEIFYILIALDTLYIWVVWHNYKEM